MRRIYDSQVVHDGIVTDDKELMRRVREEEKTLMWAAYSPYTAKPYEKEFVNLDIADAVTLYNSLALQKDSEFTDLFNYYLLKMQESGTIERMKLRWISIANEQIGSGMSQAIQLGYEHVLLPFNCCALGILVAAGLSLLEHLFVKVVKNKEMKVPTTPLY